MVASYLRPARERGTGWRSGPASCSQHLWVLPLERCVRASPSRPFLSTCVSRLPVDPKRSTPIGGCRRPPVAALHSIYTYSRAPDGIRTHIVPLRFSAVVRRSDTGASRGLREVMTPQAPTYRLRRHRYSIQVVCHAGIEPANPVGQGFTGPVALPWLV